MATLPLWSRLTVMTLAGILGGLANALVGGGTFITFPALLAVGVPALTANLTTTVGVAPSFFASLRVFRDEIRQRIDLLKILVPLSVAGTLAGTALLFAGTPSLFRSVVPWMIGIGTVLFAASPWLGRRLTTHTAHPTRQRLLYVGVFFVSIYGGYFGAGLGIMFMAVLGVTLSDDLHTLQALRGVLSIAITLSAAVVFLIHGGLNSTGVWCLLTGTLIGGWLGALVVRRLPPVWMRALVIVVGAATTVRLLL